MREVKSVLLGDNDLVAVLPAPGRCGPAAPTLYLLQLARPLLPNLVGLVEKAPREEVILPLQESPDRDRG